MSAIRSARNILASTSRALVQRGAQRSFSFARPGAVLQASRTVGASSLTMARQFSVSARVQGEGAADVALVQKLAEELQYEKEAAVQDSPEFLTQFQQQGVWTINDVVGNDEVTLTRTFGNEQIRLMFSIADINNPSDYEVEGQDENGEQATENITSNSIRISLSITKSTTPGAMTIDALCQDGAFLLENVSFYGDARVGTELTADADWKRRGLYIGPPFENLDTNVQDEFEKFLDERGVNENLAMFIPDYADHKEQTEYLRWLEGVKNFIEK